jgi:DNA-directed RNA polymerase specialized sigma24 family protein
MATPILLEDLALQALEGDRDALDSLVRALQGDVYGLALRMLWNREDAEDATQEILVRIVTRLSQFRFQSSLRTWVYRLAVNCLLDLLHERGARPIGDSSVPGLLIAPCWCSNALKMP